MPDLCPHGDHPSCCLDCLDGPPPPSAIPKSAPRVSGSGYVVAQFEGWCPGCDDEVSVGDKITEFSPGRWGHIGCVAPG